MSLRRRRLYRIRVDVSQADSERLEARPAIERKLKRRRACAHRDEDVEERP
jgi:hypothetical protein